ncbi:MAG: YihY/virulence factor BrkB family protein [Cyanobacteria bacterium P01_F01_bin.150]
MKPRKIPPLLHDLLRSRFIQLFVHTFMRWQQAECLEMGASLSYYALFSLFPIFLVIWSLLAKVAPRIICYEPLQNLLAFSFAQVDQSLETYCTSSLNLSSLLDIVGQYLPSDEAYNIVAGTLNQLQDDSTSASIIGFIILFFSASNVFAALDRAVQKIWQLHKQRQGKQNFVSAILQFVFNKILAFALVLGTVVLIIISFLSKIVVGVLDKLLQNVDNRISFIQIDDLGLISGLQFGVTILMFMVVVMILFKVLPSTNITWRDVLPGSILTVALFIIFQHLVSNSIISIGSRFKSYGVIGGVMVLMFWIYLTCQIFFMGNALTYAYTHLYGSRHGKPIDQVH